MSLTANRVRTAAKLAWGPVNSCRQLPGLKGVYEVDTWGHGGYLVSDELFDLHPALRERFVGTRYTSNGTPVLTFYEFEEDAAWAVLALFHPEVLVAINRDRALRGSDPIDRQYVADSVGRWYPELLPLAPVA